MAATRVRDPFHAGKKGDGKPDKYTSNGAKKKAKESGQTPYHCHWSTRKHEEAQK